MLDTFFEGENSRERKRFGLFFRLGKCAKMQVISLLLPGSPSVCVASFFRDTQEVTQSCCRKHSCCLRDLEEEFFFPKLSSRVTASQSPPPPTEKKEEKKGRFFVGAWVGSAGGVGVFQKKSMSPFLRAQQQHPPLISRTVKKCRGECVLLIFYLFLFSF